MPDTYEIITNKKKILNGSIKNIIDILFTC